MFVLGCLKQVCHLQWLHGATYLHSTYPTTIDNRGVIDMFTLVVVCGCCQSDIMLPQHHLNT
jgi:hypothetical protein